MSEKRLCVCIVLEGSYPYITGGVSAWVHDLIVNLPELDFKLFTISPEANQPLRYKLPLNVIESRDILLGAPPGTALKTPRKKVRLMKEVWKYHQMMEANNPPDTKKMIGLIPEKTFLYHLAVKSRIGWKMIARGNRKNNPLYPFSDYYWAWKSSHDMLFSVLGAEAPKADIYHAVSTGFAGLAALAARFRHSKPFLLTEHGLYHKEREMEIRKTSFVRGYQRDMWIKVYNKISRICYSQADHITALFEENRQKQLELGAPPERTEVIPNGIDVERFTIKREPKPGYHVGLVGRVVPIKDIKTFISTCKIVAERVPEARFYCIGPTDEDEGYYEDCKLLVENLKLKDVFEFTGRQDVRDYYKFLDVLLLTSVREAQPLVFLEGYCAGVPAVSTIVGNVPELLSFDERFLAPSKDSSKIAEGIMILYNNPGEVEKLRIKNYQKVLNFYDIKDLHRRYREMYKELAEGEIKE
ncbi:GT4 family glycosyltransferase PelF [Oceanispirochaeta sp.]|jgi:glycosyltransferase involved in cell wall biosynthesis|uniref:GT4 family glycosyltransferase PelF n=1 Tax=Oceanispirochaeta sp. TaxID=2035350 RepID=UPI0026179EC9|nr:GT4 family glycosyltransferase PelF [Oceanispirochaeta sp.]MDA3955444.1 GT4 family glycosyltransferase PelF [Oceanispirochaeta sp.]